MNLLRTEEEVDQMIAKLIERTKGKYITQGVSFNKSCPRQMGLLKKALMTSVSFSGLSKELLAIKFSEQPVNFREMEKGFSSSPPLPEIKKKNVGNFI